MWQIFDTISSLPVGVLILYIQVCTPTNLYIHLNVIYLFGEKLTIDLYELHKFISCCDDYLRFDTDNNYGDIIFDRKLQ